MLNITISEVVQSTPGGAWNQNIVHLEGKCSIHLKEITQRVKVKLLNIEQPRYEYGLFPGSDKEMFKNLSELIVHLPSNLSGLKTNDFCLIRWRLLLQDDDLPFKVKYASEELMEGGHRVTVSYRLQKLDMIINKVSISIPLPQGITTVESEDQNFELGNSSLIWTIPTIDRGNGNAAIVFRGSKLQLTPFEPIKIKYESNNTFSDMAVHSVRDIYDRPVYFDVRRELKTDILEITE